MKTPSMLSLSLRAGYVVIVAFATLAEPSLDMATHALRVRLGEAMDTAFTGRDIVDAIRNLALFAGWGAVWFMTSPPGKARPVLMWATLSGALLSIAVEAFQLIVPTRTPAVSCSTGRPSGA